MFYVSEEYLRRYQETGEIGESTLDKVVAPGESLFPPGKEFSKGPPKEIGFAQEVPRRKT